MFFKAPAKRRIRRTQLQYSPQFCVWRQTLESGFKIVSLRRMPCHPNLRKVVDHRGLDARFGISEFERSSHPCSKAKGDLGPANTPF
jgi:hypothetical protein